MIKKKTLPSYVQINMAVLRGWMVKYSSVQQKASREADPADSNAATPRRHPVKVRYPSGQYWGLWDIKIMVSRRQPLDERQEETPASWSSQ